MEDIYLVSNEDADSFLVVGTVDKNKAIKFLRKALVEEYDFEDEYLPIKSDLELRDVFETKGMLWWENAPEDATFKQKLWTYSI